MPLVPCKGCGGTTNTALSNCVHPEPRGFDLKEAYECYLKLTPKWSNFLWERGCAFEKWEKGQNFIDKMFMMKKSGS